MGASGDRGDPRVKNDWGNIGSNVKLSPNPIESNYNKRENNM